MNREAIIQAINRFYPFGAEGYLNFFTESRKDLWFDASKDPFGAATVVMMHNKYGNVWFSPSLRREPLDDSRRLIRGRF